MSLAFLTGFHRATLSFHGPEHILQTAILLKILGYFSQCFYHFLLVPIGYFSIIIKKAKKIWRY